MQHIKRARKIGKILLRNFNSEKGIFGHRNIPGDEKPESVKRGSYEHRMFVTMIVSIDYMRDANQLWEAGKKTFEDESLKWLFYPIEIIKRNNNEVIEAMQKYKLSKKIKRDAVKIWIPIAESFYRLFDSDPLKLIKLCSYDAYEVYNKMRFDYRKQFPYLSGEKILPLWIYFMHELVDIKMKNINKVPIPVDVHIARATLTTGCLTGNYKGSIPEIREVIDKVWRKTCKGTRHYRLQFDFPLWNLSKYGCSYRINDSCDKKDMCPVSEFCVNGKIYVSQSKGIEVVTHL